MVLRGQVGGSQEMVQGVPTLPLPPSGYLALAAGGGEVTPALRVNPSQMWTEMLGLPGKTAWLL